jgi:hypothetical protein
MTRGATALPLSGLIQVRGTEHVRASGLHTSTPPRFMRNSTRCQLVPIEMGVAGLLKLIDARHGDAHDEGGTVDC